MKKQKYPHNLAPHADAPPARTVLIPIKRARDADALKRALADPEIYAFAVIVGTLLPLSERKRANILTFAINAIEEELPDGQEL